MHAWALPPPAQQALLNGAAVIATCTTTAGIVGALRCLAGEAKNVRERISVARLSFATFSMFSLPYAYAVAFGTAVGTAAQAQARLAGVPAVALGLVCTSAALALLEQTLRDQG